MTKVESAINTEGYCPNCHKAMEKQSPRHYYCQTCRQHYYENYTCPICQQMLEQIKGCGAINYLCRTDGLISASKVIFRYQVE